MAIKENVYYLCANVFLTPLFSTGPSSAVSEDVHPVKQKSIGLKFSKSRTGSDVRYSCHHNLSRFTSPIFAHRGVSLSSFHYNQSHRVYINRRQQYICLI